MVLVNSQNNCLSFMFGFILEDKNRKKNDRFIMERHAF